MKEIFAHALKIVGVEASEAIHVGDNLENDFLGPQRVGMDSFYIERGNKNIPEQVPKEKAIQSLVKLVEML